MRSNALHPINLHSWEKKKVVFMQANVSVYANE